MGELHLDIIVDRMKREFKVEANVGAPQVAYRETIESSAEFEYIHKKQSGGAGQFAKVKLLVEPQEPGAEALKKAKIEMKRTDNDHGKDSSNLKKYERDYS